MEAVSVDLPEVGPISWAVRAGSSLFTAQVPIREDGTFELGSIEAQAELTFKNLEKTLKAAGTGLQSVAQVLVFLTDVRDAKAMTEVWKRYFKPPWPNRAVLGVSALAIPKMRIEITAVAFVPPP